MHAEPAVLIPPPCRVPICWACQSQTDEVEARERVPVSEPYASLGTDSLLAMLSPQAPPAWPFPKRSQGLWPWLSWRRSSSEALLLVSVFSVFSKVLPLSPKGNLSSSVSQSLILIINVCGVPPVGHTSCQGTRHRSPYFHGDYVVVMKIDNRQKRDTYNTRKIIQK